MHLFGSIRGEYKVCCFAEYAPNTPILGKHNDDINSVWNGDPLKQIRKDFLAGNTVPACEYACFSKEKLGGQSHRQIMNKNYSHLAYLQDMTQTDGSLDTFPIYLDVRFGNVCNFRCRMCGPESSTSWYKEMPSELKKPLDSYTNNETFWKNIDIIAPHLRDIYFAGGEPLVQEGHYKLLTYLVDNKYSKNITLSYNTNLSYTRFKSYDVKMIWKNFKKVKLWPSCEGFEKSAEYSRKGLVWKTFNDNIEHYKEYVQTISSVISIYSISTMPEFLLWAKRKNLRVHGTTLINPAHMSVTCLPKHAKRSINLKFKDFLLTNFDLFDSEELDMIKSWLSFMNSKDDSLLLKDFKLFNEKYDKTRDEKFEVIYPEYNTWYNNI